MRLDTESLYSRLRRSVLINFNVLKARSQTALDDGRQNRRAMHFERFGNLFFGGLVLGTTTSKTAF